jgi:SAM-dependent methyltransferase
VVTARDGSPVDLYARLPDRGEGAIAASAIPPDASILELGCGTGRMTRQLVALGFTVTAVDESPEMLTYVRDAETVCARIEGLDLRRRFDATLLASNLLSDDDARREFLDTCRRHSDLVVIETLPLGWEPPAGDSLRIDRIEDGVVHGEVFYEVDGRSWSHAFSMRVFADQAELDDALAEGGFRFGRWLDAGRGWLTATAR